MPRELYGIDLKCFQVHPLYCRDYRHLSVALQETTFHRRIRMHDSSPKSPMELSPYVLVRPRLRLQLCQVTHALQITLFATAAFREPVLIWIMVCLCMWAFAASSSTQTPFPIAIPWARAAPTVFLRWPADGTRAPLAEGTHVSSSTSANLKMLYAPHTRTLIKYKSSEGPQDPLLKPRQSTPAS